METNYGLVEWTWTKMEKAKPGPKNMPCWSRIFAPKGTDITAFADTCDPTLPYSGQTKNKTKKEEGKRTKGGKKKKKKKWNICIYYMYILCVYIMCVYVWLRSENIILYSCCSESLSVYVRNSWITRVNGEVWLQDLPCSLRPYSIKWFNYPEWHFFFNIRIHLYLCIRICQVYVYCRVWVLFSDETWRTNKDGSCEDSFQILTQGKVNLRSLSWMWDLEDEQRLIGIWTWPTVVVVMAIFVCIT